MSNPEMSFVIDAVSPDGKWLCVFEDNGETGYLYFCTLSPEGELMGISDALWIYNQISPSIHECKQVHMIWSNDSAKTALIVDGECWGMFDLTNRRKLTAPRSNNGMESIPTAVLENGIPEHLGEPLEFEVKS
ncbi:DUF2251 domain-containing protein [Paenibacillus mucilaginosus]|uniref:DUF2251 domain-containing protein n=2 Tax=Paenibacillus mucilaginosus TaxID=61624 RepID=H6NFN5_9BACL|nr:DUF2251 domain-containing protein [Paenibacillus mucilaginosus]AEI42986.1 hypothetical protein KNP414_04455 [Paenibacillus mucilaginosus KNP414]AFC30675.1 hypothetical protein PM3016_3868 [Paenibacillus mucilaginosus 3016]MCG7216097.1 DUF2251 domain-containing protein [Paenibacillus mucilaginosus]WDM24614.1 DUF2251 domain-containing protein [Paenibacillus mucilaginosus]WFA19288.1 DUF2251 domain-containing protein [Paenibacillus mucilaginosus]